MYTTYYYITQVVIPLHMQFLPPNLIISTCFPILHNNLPLVLFTTFYLYIQHMYSKYFSFHCPQYNCTSVITIHGMVTSHHSRENFQ